MENAKLAILFWVKGYVTCDEITAGGIDVQ